MDAVTQALIETIGAAGLAVQLGASEGHHVIEAVNDSRASEFHTGGHAGDGQCGQDRRNQITLWLCCLFRNNRCL